MKQIIGYIESDFMMIKHAMWYTAIIFAIVSAIFSMKSGVAAVGYMLFGGLVLASTLFTAVPIQTVSFSALAPGSTWQKVVGRYLGCILTMILFVCLGLAGAGLMRLFGLAGGETDLRILTAMVGIGLLFLAIQNVMLYLCLPILGMQFTNIVRMVPGFVMFFLVMQPKSLETISDIVAMSAYPELILLGVGIVSLAIGLFLSYLIQRKRMGK